MKVPDWHEPDYDRDRYDDRSAWDEDFNLVLDEMRLQEQRDRYQDLWARLERMGTVRHPDDDDMTLRDLERIAAYLPRED